MDGQWFPRQPVQFVGRGVAVFPPASLSFEGEASDATNGTSYSFASQPFGTAAADRYIIVAIHTASGGTRDNSVTSCTIGGVTASLVAQASGVTGSTSSHVVLAIAAVPTGTSGTVAFSVNEESNRSIIAVYRATGLQSGTPTDTDTDDTASGPSCSIDCQAGGFVIAGLSGNNDPNSGAITNLTENVDTEVESTILVAASAEFETAQTALSLVGSWGSSPAAGCMGAAAFR